MNGKPSHIDPVRGHKPPSGLTKPERRTPKQVDDPEAVKRRIQDRNDRLTEQPKPKIKERIMGALLNQLLAFFRTWLYGRPVYKTRTNDKGEVEFILDENGKKIMNIPLTILGRVLQVLGAFGLLSATVFGKTLGEWIPLVEDILRVFGGG